MSASFKSESAPMRFWIPCKLACQSTEPSAAFAGSAEGVLDEFWEDGWVARRMPSMTACGMSKIKRGK